MEPKTKIKIDFPPEIMAYFRETGRQGGAARTPAQTLARQINGKNGGRPINPNSKRQQILRNQAIKLEEKLQKIRAKIGNVKNPASTVDK